MCRSIAATKPVAPDQFGDERGRPSIDPRGDVGVPALEQRADLLAQRLAVGVTALTSAAAAFHDRISGDRHQPILLVQSGTTRRVSGIAHWDAVEGARREAGHLDAEWFDLGSAAGTDKVGVHRIRVEPGAWSTPAHMEHGEEEIF